MGRAKVDMELIRKEKSRNITFKKRKEGLMRKMHEFTTLCDVSSCMIIYGPKQEKGAVEPEIWPRDLDKVRQIIDDYKAKSKESVNKTYGLADFLHDRKRKIEEELAKLRKKNMEAKYPTWLEFMNGLTEAQLREFAAALSNKAKYLKSRIELLRRNRECLDMNLMDFAHARLSQSPSFYPPGIRGVEFEVINQQAISPVKPIDMYVPIHYPTMDHQELHSVNQNPMMHSVNQNSLMMLLMNDNDHCVQFGGPSSGGNMQRASTSFKHKVFYESAPGVGMADPFLYQSPKPLARYYAPSVQPPVPPVQPYMQCTVVPGMAPPQLQLSTKERDDGEDDF